MGIHASPTCVLAYGERGGATGYLVGEENRGWTYAKFLLGHERTNIAGIGIAKRELARLKRIAARERLAAELGFLIVHDCQAQDRKCGAAMAVGSSIPGSLRK